MPIFLAGDLNDLPWSETAENIAGSELFNSGLSDQTNEQFSYIFEGNAQQLDYIFVNKNFVDKIDKAIFFHINTILDQSDQISDHDPFFLEIDLFSD
jgi:predicted extracellular nuclease